MKKYNIENPTEFKLTITYKGIEYSIDAKSSLKNVEEELAKHWKKNIHQFLTISETTDSVTEKIKEAVNEIEKSNDENKVTLEKKVIKNKK